MPGERRRGSRSRLLAASLMAGLGLLLHKRSEVQTTFEFSADRDTLRSSRRSLGGSLRRSSLGSLDWLKVSRTTLVAVGTTILIAWGIGSSQGPAESWAEVAFGALILASILGF